MSKLKKEKLASKYTNDECWKTKMKGKIKIISIGSSVRYIKTSMANIYIIATVSYLAKEQMKKKTSFVVSGGARLQNLDMSTTT